MLENVEMVMYIHISVLFNNKSGKMKMHGGITVMLLILAVF